MDLLILLEGVSAALAFILVRFMVKPYRTFEDSRYLALPLGFVFLGFSYIFMGISLFLATPAGIERAKWMHLFTGTYGFTFLAVTYYVSSFKSKKKMRPVALSLIALSFLLLIFLVVILFLLPMFEIPDYKIADEYFRLFNMAMAFYIVFYTLRKHMVRSEPRTVFAPLAYALLAFSQYSLLIWSVDTSYFAFVSAHILRVLSLLVFIYVSFMPLSPLKKPTDVKL